MKPLKPCVIWFTGYSGAGKSSLASELAKQLSHCGISTYLLDGDVMRHNLSQDLSFSKADRDENIRRAGNLAKQQLNAGKTVICAFISPYREGRNNVRRLFNAGEFVEVFVDTALSVCEQRDVKGLYQRARKGEIKNFTGIDSPYEPPLQPDIHIKTSHCYTNGTEIADSAKRILNYLSSKP